MQYSKLSASAPLSLTLKRIYASSSRHHIPLEKTQRHRQSFAVIKGLHSSTFRYTIKKTVMQCSKCAIMYLCRFPSHCNTRYFVSVFEMNNCSVETGLEDFQNNDYIMWNKLTKYQWCFHFLCQFWNYFSGEHQEETYS